MLDLLNITKALTDENRIRIVLALRRRPLCVCQLTAFLDLAPSTTSRHLSVLRQARLIEGRKSGKWVYYRLPEEDGLPLAVEMLRLVVGHLEHQPRFRRDEARIRKILEREDLLCAGMSAAEKDLLHSPELHLLEQEAYPPEEGSFP